MQGKRHKNPKPLFLPQSPINQYNIPNTVMDTSFICFQKLLLTVVKNNPLIFKIPPNRSQGHDFSLVPNPIYLTKKIRKTLHL